MAQEATGPPRSVGCETCNHTFPVEPRYAGRPGRCSRCREAHEPSELQVIQVLGVVIASCFSLGIAASLCLVIEAGPSAFLPAMIHAFGCLVGCGIGLGLYHRERKAFLGLCAFAFLATPFVLIGVVRALFSSGPVYLQGFLLPPEIAFLGLGQWILIYAIPIGYTALNWKEIRWARP